MKKIVGLCIFILFGTQVYAQDGVQGVAQLLLKHKFKKLHKCLDANMSSQLSQEDISKLWLQLEEVSGNYVSTSDIEVKPLDDGTKQTAIVRFEQRAYTLMVAFNGDQKISGMFVSMRGYQIPKYGDGLSIGKRNVQFVSDSFILSGELVIPVDCNNCPVVIFVHGSGPRDLDETIGPIKVFKDIALGLASHGIASFRYNKRSILYPHAFTDQFDLYDETINDAIAAFNIIHKDTSLHFDKFYMAGHSLGAFAMPLIVDSLSTQLDGAILLSGPAKKLDDLISYQMDYLTQFDGTISSDEKQLIEENNKGAQRIKNGDYTMDTKASELLAYWPGTFWKGIEGYNPVTTVYSNSTTPFLILQGEKDYQITMEDFAIWQNKVGDRKNVKLRSFAGLTHLFTPTDAERGSPQDYFTPNNVDKRLVDTIVEWVETLY